MQTEVYFIAGSEYILYAFSDVTKREKHIAVQVPEHNLIHPVRFEQLSKKRRLQPEPHGRVVYERYKRIALSFYLFDLFEAQLEALGFAQVKFFVMLGIVGAARASPAA